ncbi:MAG: protein kinase [Vicinamibacteria bacterium]
MRMGLLGRTTLALAVVGLVPLLVVPWIIGLNRDAMTEQVLRLHAVAAQGTAARVAAYLEPLQASAAAAAGNPLVAADPRSRESREVLSALLQSQSRLIAVSVANAAGEEFIRAQTAQGRTAAEALLADPQPRALRAASVEGRLYFRLDAPLPGGAGQVRLLADASSFALLTRPEELGEQALLAVAAPDGGIVAVTRPGARLDEFPRPLTEAASSGRLSGSGRYAGEGGREVLGAYAPVAGSDWFVLSAQPATVAEAVARSMRRRALLALLAAALLTAGASAVAWRQVVRPLRELVSAQRRLAGGGGQRSGNEIEELRASFGALERQVKDRDQAAQVFLGRYQVLEPIGSGGMGTVFKAFDPKLQRNVALKTVHLGESLANATQGEQVRTLLQEAITVARFSHPNIVGIFDLEDLGDAAFVAMELVEGRSLERHLSSAVRLPSQETVPLLAAIARGLSAAHGAGIVHRDIKPANVLLGLDGSIKIADFGIAAALSMLAEQADMVFGTPGYLPPESLRGAKQNEKGDLFALGVIAYECLTGGSPFEGRGPQEVMDRTLDSEPAEIGEMLASVPEELAEITMGLLKKDPAQRLPATALEVADRLERLAAQNGWRFAPDLSREPAFDELPSHTFSMAVRRGSVAIATRAQGGA